MFWNTGRTASNPGGIIIDYTDSASTDAHYLPENG